MYVGVFCFILNFSYWCPLYNSFPVICSIRTENIQFHKVFFLNYFGFLFTLHLCNRKNKAKEDNFCLSLLCWHLKWIPLRISVFCFFIWNHKLAGHDFYCHTLLLGVFYPHFLIMSSVEKKNLSLRFTHRKGMSFSFSYY